jgi:cytochrome c553
MPGKGPDLAKVASQPQRDVEWFINQVNQPQKNKADTKMPPFAGKIKDEDMHALAEFLASLK